MVLKEDKKYNKSGKQNSHSRSNTEYISHGIVSFYLFLMLGVFPLYFKKQYEGIGSAKYDFFWTTSLLFLGGMAIWFIVESVINLYANIKKEQLFHKIHTGKISLSFLDVAVLFYGISVIFSFLLSNHKEFALKGANGWNMGLYAQLIFVGLYFVISRKGKLSKLILSIHMISSGLVFLLGILHRFEIDPLGMYVGLNLQQKTEFLSTLGQATWYSSYVCTVFGLGLTVFYLSKNWLVKVLSGIYTILSFGTLVTQNSDSAFMALLGVCLILGYFSLTDIYRWTKFWQILVFMWGTFLGIGMLQKKFAERAIPLDSLSIFFSQSIIIWLLFGVSILLYIYYGTLYLQQKKQGSVRKKEKRGTRGDIIVLQRSKKVYQRLLIILAVGIVVTILFIYLNTKGYLLDWFGFQTKHSYLYFDYLWGNGRGSSWMIAWQEFWKLPTLNKLFGVGPDCFFAYLYSIPETKEYLHRIWGGLTLTNAHNEYLNSFICYGIVGTTAWLAVIMGGIRYFYRKAKEQPFYIAFALSLGAYGCHNIFCYQQVCCTPFLFILLGLGECLTKSPHFFTIYPKLKQDRRRNHGR